MDINEADLEDVEEYSNLDEVENWDEDDLADENMSTFSDIVCEICKIDEDDDNVILCDKCNRGFHLYCLKPPLKNVPDDKWFCKKCRFHTKTPKTSGMTSVTIQWKIGSNSLPEKGKARINNSFLHLFLHHQQLFAIVESGAGHPVWAVKSVWYPAVLMEKMVLFTGTAERADSKGYTIKNPLLDADKFINIIKKTECCYLGALILKGLFSAYLQKKNVVPFTLVHKNADGLNDRSARMWGNMSSNIHPPLVPLSAGKLNFHFPIYLGRAATEFDATFLPDDNEEENVPTIASSSISSNAVKKQKLAVVPVAAPVVTNPKNGKQSTASSSKRTNTATMTESNMSTYQQELTKMNEARAQLRIELELTKEENKKLRASLAQMESNYQQLKQWAAQHGYH